MAETVDLFVPLDDDRRAARRRAWSGRSAGRAGRPARVRVLRRSLDARKGRPLGQRLRVRGRARRARRCAAPAPPRRRRAGRRARAAPRVVVVGSGPAGIWAALRLGRGGRARRRSSSRASRCSRAAAISRCSRAAQLDPDSNYCFGEGGAGTYSDGKLYTRAKKRGGVADVIAIWCASARRAEIVVDARPHIGSNRLPQGDHRRCASTSRRWASTYRFEPDGRGPARRRAGACARVRLAGGDEIAGRRRRAGDRALGARCTRGRRRRASRSSASRSRSACASSTRSR